MKTILLLAILGACAAEAQITTYTPQLIGARVGSAVCYFYGNLPAPKQVHTVCYVGLALVRNQVSALTADVAHTDTFVAQNQTGSPGTYDASIGWQFILDPDGVHINYQIGIVPNGTVALGRF
jgi:hypothetical protein